MASQMIFQARLSHHAGKCTLPRIFADPDFETFINKNEGKKMIARESVPAILVSGAPTLASALANGVANHTFHHAIDIYLKDSNAFTNTYFSRYFEWQGVCREWWFHECIHGNLMSGDGIFVTKRASQEYVEETFPFQHVDCFLNTFRVRPCSIYLVIRFSVTERLAALGYQQVVFKGKDHHIQRFPDQLTERFKDYQITLGTL